MNSMKSIVTACALACAFAAPLAAQNPDGPYWTEYPLPAGTVNVAALGSLAVVQTGTDVHLYSGLLRQWTVLPISPSATVQYANRYCIVQDGSQIHGWSAATGIVRSLTVSNAALFSFGSASSSWASIVVDGSQVYGFSAFLGEWTPMTLQGSLQHFSVGSHGLVVADDVNVYGFSAFFGTWVATPTRPGAAYQALRSGAMALLSGPDEVVAFSAYQNTWQRLVQPGFANAVIADKDGCAVVTQGSEAVVFSTMTGNLLHRAFGAPPVVNAGRNVVVFDDGGVFHGYAPGVDTFTVLTPGVAQLHVPSGSLGSYVVYDDGSGLHAFNGLTGAVTTGPVGPFTVSVGDTAAFADGNGGTSFAFSALLDRWVVAPSATSGTAQTNFECVLLANTNGYEAFSARTGNWASLTSVGGLNVQAAGALVAAIDGNGIDVFDPVLDRWVRQATGSSPLWSVWRLTGIAHDGTTAYGYSLFHHTWESIPLQGAVTAFRANSSIGYVRTTSHVYVFTANGSLSNESRVPEFSRFLVRGGRLTHKQVAAAGTGVVAAFGLTMAETPLPPLGTLWIEPSTMVTVPLGVVPAGGVMTTNLTLPSDPSWSGRVLFMQDLLVPTVGAPWLSNVMAPYVW